MRSLTILGAAALVALAAGCASAPAEDAGVATAPAASVAAPAEALAPPEPEPGRTVEPQDETTGALRLPLGFRIAVIIEEGDPNAEVLRDAVHTAVGDRAAVVDVVSGPGTDAVVVAVTRALRSDPDLVIGAGEGTVDGFSYATAENLQTQFLVLGGQLPEPTANVTAVIWPGASSRGSATAEDAEADATFTSKRGISAANAGISSVAGGVTGVVIALGG